MKRLFWFCGRREVVAPAAGWALSADQHRRVLALLSEVGLLIVREARGPVPLLAFGRRVLERLEVKRGAVPLAAFSDALKRVIREMGDAKLRVMSPTEFIGVGYVYDAGDPETYPVRTSR
jgi:hypothetical protein